MPSQVHVCPFANWWHVPYIHNIYRVRGSFKCSTRSNYIDTSQLHIRARRIWDAAPTRSQLLLRRIYKDSGHWDRSSFPIGIDQGNCIGLEGIGNGTLSTSGTACSCNLFIYMLRMWGVHQRFSSTKREEGVHLFLGVYVHHSRSTSSFVKSDSDNGCTTSFRSTYI